MKKKQQFKLSNKKLIILLSLILCVAIIMLATTLIYSGQVQDQKNIELTNIAQNQQTEDTKKQPETKKTTAETKTAEKTAEQKSDSTKTETKTETKTTTEKPKTTEQTQKQTAKTETKTESAKKETVPAVPSVPSVPKTEKNTKGTKTGKIVIVFDDAGHNMTQLKPFLSLPFKATIAILPKLPHSKEAANAIRSAGIKAILHQPMQAVNLNVSPGDGAITPEMHAYEIEQLVLENLAEVGSVIGMNNHEGSLITATQSSIGTVLDVCKNKGIIFLDSRTNSESKAKPAALERGMNILERDIFLDNVQEKSEITKMFNQGLKIADKKGYVIMIGHIWCKNLAQILTELYANASNQGYQFITLDELFNELY